MTNAGPACWKCKGLGKVKQKRRRSVEAVPARDGAPAARRCPVCAGDGRLPPKRASSSAGSQGAGVITWSRRHPPGWRDRGPGAHAVARDKGSPDALAGERAALRLLAQARRRDSADGGRGAGVAVPPPEVPDMPRWIPLRDAGEQLCNLVGNWRILQRVGSHRWTTDDLVTAYVASRVALGSTLPGQRQEDSPVIDEDAKSSMSYLDLGTGNASVLQMTCWALWLHYERIEAYGVEARAEAVGLARRSLSFNIGDADGGTRTARVVRADFRDILDGKGAGSCGDDVAADPLLAIRSGCFDLITGTPPYFRVDFATVAGNGTAVTAATIVQGGMPTSVQSAPARCEFRGGIEAYCGAAAAVLAPTGHFVACENWLNDRRVYAGAREAGLSVVAVLPIKGKEGKKENLFAVYVMQKTITGKCRHPPVQLPALAVRNMIGGWTEEYSRILDDMSIPRIEDGDTSLEDQ